MTSVNVPGRVPPTGGARDPRSPVDDGPPVERWRNRDKWAAIAFLTPNVLLFSLFVVLPVIGGVGLSFFSWNLMDDPRFIGLDNYARLFSDQRAISSLGRTLAFTIGGVVPTVALGFVSASLINIRMRGIEVIRTFYYMPLVISFAASAVLWSWVFSPSRGLMNWVLSLIGIQGPAWLSSTTWALPSLIVILIWLSLPLVTLLYLAALQGISEEVIEASRLDGAGPLRRLIHITFPMVRNATVLVTVVMMLAFAFGSFDLVQILTEGGPLRSTDILVYYMFDMAFVQLNMGYASTLAVFQFVVIFGITGTLLYFNRRTEN